MIVMLQGRGDKTHAYTHALETDHHMFMKLDDGRVYCLPEKYEVVDRSLDIIRFVLNPTFTSKEVISDMTTPTPSQCFLYENMIALGPS